MLGVSRYTLYSRLQEFNIIDTNKFTNIGIRTRTIKCANNNCATTVMDALPEGVNENNGQPVCVCFDHGGESIEVWMHMLTIWGDPSHVITGSSTHNERVGRILRDVTLCVSHSYINLFSALETEGTLDQINEVDLFSLH